jgi:hypothetical protein
MQDAKPACGAFRWPGSVLGARCPAFGADRVPGPRCQVPDTWYPVPGTKWNARLMLRKTRTRGMHPVSCIRILTEPYLPYLPDTWRPEPEP